MNFFKKKAIIEEETLKEEEPEKEFEEEEEEEERCKANDCQIKNCKEDDIQWVLCDVYRSSCDLFCLDLSRTPKKFKCLKY